MSVNRRHRVRGGRSVVTSGTKRLSRRFDDEWRKNTKRFSRCARRCFPAFISPHAVSFVKVLAPDISMFYCCMTSVFQIRKRINILLLVIVWDTSARVLECQFTGVIWSRQYLEVWLCFRECSRSWCSLGNVFVERTCSHKVQWLHLERALAPSAPQHCVYASVFVHLCFIILQRIITLYSCLEKGHAILP